MSKIIVALDGMRSREEIVRFAEKLKGKVWGFKVNDALVKYGSIIYELTEYGKVFADPKLHDIPNTVINSMQHLVGAGADLVTVHISGGEKMVKTAIEVAGPERVLGVGKLTSLTDEEFFGMDKGDLQIFYDESFEWGLRNVVVPPNELWLGDKFNLRVCPDIRRLKEDVNDQIDVNTPTGAIMAGANLLVIGRLITQSDDPVKTVDEINQEIKEAEESPGRVVEEDAGTSLS